jgi:hypothetical protein
MDGVMNGSMKITHSGCHVQAASLPQGDIPLRLTVDQIEGVDAEDITYPKPRAFRLAGLDDRRHVYEGKVQLQVPIHFGARESIELVARLQYTGLHGKHLPASR